VVDSSSRTGLSLFILTFCDGGRIQKKTGEQAGKNSQRCHSERSEESLFVLFSILGSKRDSSVRSE
jgi:hypothetical protein